MNEEVKKNAEEHIERWEEEWGVWFETFCEGTGMSLAEAFLYRLALSFSDMLANQESMIERARKVIDYQAQVIEDMEEAEAWREEYE